MTDYKKLVKFLRGLSPWAFPDASNKIMTDAADAIDALQEQVRMLDKHDTDLHNEGYDVGYYAGRRDWEPKQGKWIHEMNVYDEPFYHCSACGEFFDSNRDDTHGIFNYCPICGAKMEGET